MGNGIIKVSNLRKTYYYLKKNGLKNAYYAAMERMKQERSADYYYQTLKENELELQKKESSSYSCLFSILVPAYETDAVHMREMIDSVRNQTYGKWELIIADASSSNQVRNVIETYKDERIRYIKLKDNKGISENTNAALTQAKGDYIGLLDHDDILTPDALYEMVIAIHKNENNGEAPWMLYSDEDKGNGECTEFYEPHIKQSFNIDMLLSNNYICHFLVMKQELMKELGFRPEYNGAQDYDLVLRAAGKLLDKKTAIVHVKKVLYHWRCHTGSTAENPESKRYAYDAGRRAVADFIKTRGWNGEVKETLHLGFYKIEYEGDVFKQRPEVGVIGGKVLNAKKRIISGMYDEDGTVLYAGLHKEYSGYMHRASLLQEAYAVDIRSMRVRKELHSIFEEIFHIPYTEDGHTGCFAYKTLTLTEVKMKEYSIKFCQKVKELGYVVLWIPDVTVQMK